MEISNNTSPNHTTFLQNRQASNTARNTVLPLEQLKEKQHDSASEKANHSLSNVGSHIEKTGEAQKPEAMPPGNIVRAHQQAHSSRQNNAANYRVVAHEQQLAHQAEKAIASYNRIENSQYGQELVNRIELLV